ncbi:uncharacterized protein GGS22DRAFT_195231 [Annulohypoxylon maeteangense]|uniref:uncharacterized protein n=1 Tax=Annulohypoxylon maeteangense TaxID=1927788 RepID=UPI0020078855|nr:uncharacterized protein GGS22DRAFT_195231 [Annulohypoxylon maeteangense]KAI0883544.1 hypothetical protein GGS22DRAFT_195231 [Annulohypoxylon maeteangense]
MAITHPQGLRPHMHAAARATAPVVAPKLGPVSSKILPSLLVLGVAYTVGSYVRSQLTREAGTMDRIFAQQNTPEVEESRRRGLQVETNGDPRNSLLNCLGWS